MEVKMINDRKFFVYYIKSEVQLDFIAIRMMEHNDISGLFPFKYIQQETDRYFRYEVKADETLEEWLARVQYKESVFKLIENLMNISEEIDVYLLEQNHICTDTSFITVKDNICELAYIPDEKQKMGSIIQLVQEIVSSVKYALDDDFSYLFDLQNAFGRKDIQTMADLKKWLRLVKGEEKMSDVSVETPYNSRLLEGEASPFISSSPNLNKEVMPDSPVLEEEERKDAFEAVFGDIGFSNKDKERAVRKTGEKHGIFSKKKKSKSEKNRVMENMTSQPIDQKWDIPKREIINDLDRGDSTVMIGAEMPPILIQVRNGMEYRLTNDSYMIGSGAQVDIMVQNNPTVSRKHARIFMNNGFYYIEDIGSTNGTSVNGEKLRKMEPYKLDDKARIKFSDEDYIFEARR